MFTHQSAKRVHVAKDLWRLISKENSLKQDLGDTFLINSYAYMYLLETILRIWVTLETDLENFGDKFSVPHSTDWHLQNRANFLKNL